MKPFKFLNKILSTEITAETWTIDIDDSEFDKFDMESVKLLFEQSEKKFESVSKVSFNITVRSYTFLAVVISFVSFFSSLSLGQSIQYDLDLPVHLLWIIPLIVALFLLILNVLPHNMMHGGFEPSTLTYKNTFVNPKVARNLVHQNLLICLMEDNQWKINYTNVMNNKRLTRLQAAIILTSFSIISLLIIAIVTV